MRILIGMLLIVCVFAPNNFPLNEEMKSGFGGDEVSIETTCKVVKTGNVYTYFYSIKNKSHKPVKVVWETINRAMHFGNNIEMMYELDPDENQVFTLEHPDPPASVLGKVTTFHLTKKKDYEKMIASTPDIPKDFKMSLHDKNFYASTSGRDNAALPKSYVDTK